MEMTKIAVALYCDFKLGLYTCFTLKYDRQTKEKIRLKIRDSDVEKHKQERNDYCIVHNVIMRCNDSNGHR